MGSRMVKNLLDAGNTVVAYDHNRLALSRAQEAAKCESARGTLEARDCPAAISSDPEVPVVGVTTAAALPLPQSRCSCLDTVVVSHRLALLPPPLPILPAIQCVSYVTSKHNLLFSCRRWSAHPKAVMPQQWEAVPPFPVAGACQSCNGILQSCRNVSGCGSCQPNSMNLFAM